MLLRARKPLTPIQARAAGDPNVARARDSSAPTARAKFALAAGLLVALFIILSVVVAVSAPGPTRIDSEGSSARHRFVVGRPGLTSTLRLIAWITNPWWLRAIAGAAALLLYLRGRGRVALWLVITMAIGGVLEGLMKLIFARSRPEWPNPIAAIGGYSFPSGHAVNSMLAASCAVVLLDPMLRRTTPAGGPAPASVIARGAPWLLAAGFVLLVGFDRVALGVHYVTDVLAGSSVALAILFATLASFGGLEGEPQPP